MESSGRDDDPSNQFGRATSNQGSPRKALHERSSSQRSLYRNNSAHASSVGSSSRRRHSLSSRIAPDTFDDDDIESEVVSQAGDTGDRGLNSRRYSGSCSPHSSVENFMSVEEGCAPITVGPYMQPLGSLSRATTTLSTISVVSPLPSEIVSSISTEATLYGRDKDPSRSANTSLQDIKEYEKEIPLILEYVSSLTFLAVFGILGVYTRYLLRKLFGPQVIGITSDRSFAYLDLPSNVVGSFLMGWLVVFKSDISDVSDLLVIGLSTGYLGSLTTFSGWNQKMLDLSVKDLWVDAAVGIILGLGIAAMSIRFGIFTAEMFRRLLNRFSSSSRTHFRIDSLTRHMAVLAVQLLILGLLWGLNGALLRRWLDHGNTNGQLWLACIVGPPGVWARWFLARLNGRGLGRKGSLRWIPFGTLIANVSAACVMASLATVMKVVNTEKCDTIATGIQFGFLGCLSTVSTFIAEFHAMCESKHPRRASIYASITLLPSFILGTLIYSVPVWTKGYQ